MINVLFGFLGAGLCMGAVYLGFVFGVNYGHPKAEKVEHDPSLEQREVLERIKADQAAFERLMSYNADVAYGKVSMFEDIGT